MTVIRVPVDIPELTFWRLAAVAEQYDMKVPDYLAEIALAASRRQDPLVVDPVIVWWRLGLTDKQIAGELGLTNAAVGDRRRRGGFAANRRLA